MDKGILELLFAMGISVAGAVGYMHGSFATKESLEQVKTDSSSSILSIKKRTKRTDNLVCQMAIRENLNDAVALCEQPIEE